MSQVTRSQMLEKIAEGTAFISCYCYMTNEVEAFGCENCHDYGCCVNNGTGEPGVSLVGLFNVLDQTLICDLDDVVDG